MSLPNEVLDCILAYLSEDELATCALVSKSFHNAAVRLLYRDLCFDKSWRTDIGRQAVLTPIAHCKPSRVRHPKYLLQTLRGNRSLRAMVKSTSFLMFGEAGRSDIPLWATDLWKMLKDRDTGPPFVHLSSFIDSHWASLAALVSLRSLKLRVAIHLESPPTHYSLLREAMNLSSVEHITVGNSLWPEYDGIERSMADQLLSVGAFSNVKTVAFTESGLPTRDLEGFLTWPKALRSFAFEIDARRARHPNNPFKLGTFTHALQAQANSLEQVNLEYYGSHMPTTHAALASLPTSFAELVHLKRLSVPLDLLARICPISSSQPVFEECALEPALHWSMPPSLESLRIQISMYTNFHDDNASLYRGLRNSDVGSGNARERALSTWLVNFAGKAPGHCPRLVRTYVWWPSPEGATQSAHENSHGLRDVFFRQGIEFSLKSLVGVPSFGPTMTADFVPIRVSEDTAFYRPS